MRASFGAVATGMTFSAAGMTDGELSGLAGMAGFGGAVRSAWDFDTNLAGGEVLLSFDIGLGVQDLKEWHFHNGVWAPFTADLLTYDSKGTLSFTVTEFSGYAVTAVPEPATVLLLALGGLALWRKRVLT